MANKKKVNIIDILIIAAILVGIAGVVIRFGSGNSRMANAMSKIEYTVEVKGLRDYSVDALQKKGDVWDPKLKKSMGTITNISVKDAVGEDQLTNGTYVKAPIPERYDVLITIETTGKVSDTAYYSSASNELCLGKDYTLYTQWSSFYGTIQEIHTVE